MKVKYNEIIREYEDDTPFIDIIEEVEYYLHQYNINFGNHYYTISHIGRSILLTEAVNLAAKIFTEDFYYYKEILCQYCLEQGCIGWINVDEYNNEVLYLYHKDVGTSSFHFLFDDLEYYFKGPRFFGLCNKWPWSKITRQENAFEILQNEQLLNWYKINTRPRQLSYVKNI